MGGSTNNSNISSTTQEISNNERIEPETVQRLKPSSAEYINKTKILKAINCWNSKPQLHDKLKDALENLYLVNRLFDPNIHKKVYSMISIEQKIELLYDYLNKKYIFDTDDVLGGIVFVRAYNEVNNV